MPYAFKNFLFSILINQNKSESKGAGVSDERVTKPSLRSDLHIQSLK